MFQLEKQIALHGKQVGTHSTGKAAGVNGSKWHCSGQHYFIVNFAEPKQKNKKREQKLGNSVIRHYETMWNIYKIPTRV